ncbi:MAG: outer membrane beta-barrel protein [Proteobacteria bacterium]|nr:outer membrane beta-barrel protein [Desulfobulbaceae bacterium]MBU4153664.1 outer membrane beta-barrel protein [Pseudomonadota bacterium]
MKMNAYMFRVVMVQRVGVVALVVALNTIVTPEYSIARQNILTGAMAVGSNYDSNVYKSDNYRKGEWKSLLAPQFTLTSKGLTDSLALTYAPNFGYNFRREDDEMVHALSLLADKGLSSRWRVKVNGDYTNSDTLRFETDQKNLNVTQNFIRADAPTQADIVRILFPELSWDPTIHLGYVVSQFQKRYDAVSASERQQVDRLLFEGSGGRQRYWTSSMAVVSEYEFAEKSLLSLGYRFASQDSKSGNLTDHVEQAPSVLIAYQFNPQWRAELGYDLTFNTYDTSDDSTANRPHLQVDFQISPRNLVFWNYTYQQIIFDGTQSDITDQSVDLGWKHSFDQRTALTAGLGTAYLSRDLSVDEREYSLDLGLSRTFEKGVLAVTGNVVTAEDDQVGGWDKSRRSWELGSNMSYALRQNLSSNGHVSYGQWRSWSLNTQNNYDQLQAGAGLSYGLNRWFTLSLDYNYSLFDTAEALLDDYTEHLVSIKLLAAKELWRW